MAGQVEPPAVPKLINVSRWLWIASASIGMARFLAQLFDAPVLGGGMARIARSASSRRAPLKNWLLVN